MRIRRRLAAIGDVNQVATWSGTPYFLLQEARAQGFVNEGLALRPERHRAHRLVWNAATLLRTGRWGGFQYTDAFLEGLFASVEPGGEILSHFPLLPPPRWRSRWRVSYYVDATLSQNFGDYGHGGRVAPFVQREALEREREAYEQAERVVCMSRWAARSVADEYGISVSKIHVVRPGANIPRELEVPRPQPPPLEPFLRLGFIGKDWRRKGLLRLLEVAEALGALGTPARVLVIGVEKGRGPAHPLADYLGFVDKRLNAPRFVEAVQNCHLGCLLSSAEASGMSTLDCLRLGVPAIGARIGGIVDSIDESVGALFDPSDSPRAVAEEIRRLVQPDRYRALRNELAHRCEEFTWRATVRRLREIWGEADHMHSTGAVQRA